MLFERIESEGIAHYSYLIADGDEAVVIDPRRDCAVYLDKTAKEGIRITDVLETHRNEDYVVGSLELAACAKAQIWHADSQLEYRYGQPVEDGQTWQVGGLKLQAIHSPGHTLGSMSYLLHDPSGAPWVLFSGDALFAGDVGRVDFMGPQRTPEMAGHLYDTLFGKLLTLGDEVILCPAHGAGSSCAGAIVDRVWTTIGLERRLNLTLQAKSKAEFVSLVAKELEKPPYFQQMEKLNLEGAPLLGSLPIPMPLPPRSFGAQFEGAWVVDTRMELGYGAAHVPNSLSLWLQGLPRYVGWFVPYDRPILLVNETDDPSVATRRLVRLGYDNISGYLSGGMQSWHTAGQASASCATITVQALCRRLDQGDRVWILDVRSEAELEHEGRIGDAQHIHVTQLPQRMQEVPTDRDVYIFCGSGLRAMMAASLLQRGGWSDLHVVLGGLSAWNAITCPIQP